MVSKRERNHLVKAFNKGISTKQSQIQVQRQKIVILKDDEFTEHETIKKLLMNFVWDARERERDYQAHKSQMIKAVALAMEDELKNMGKPELVCHICEELMNVLKQARVNWSIKYLRKCLDERYKNPVNRLNALLRHKRDGPPGTPPDTGLTAKELEVSLSRKPIVGKYTVACELELEDNTGIWVSCVANPDEGGEILNSPYLPVIVHVNALEQTATVELDKDAHFEIIKGLTNPKRKGRRRIEEHRA